MKIINLKLKDVVEGTSTNSEGYSLYVVLDKHIKTGASVRLSLANCSPFSSSFLNSSLGALFDLHGFEYVKQRLKFTQYLTHHEQVLKKYFSDYEKFKL